MPNTLFLRLEGPLQSWGERGNWSIRDSAAEPTKSGIVGLLACALGINDDMALARLSAAVEVGVRVDREGTRLTDYHTIGGGYDRPALLTAEGKPKRNGSGTPHTEISKRDYLCDASFLAAVRGEPALIDTLAAAVRRPVWVIFLGRKSCPPARPVFAGVGEYHDLAAALQAHEWPATADGPRRAVLECGPEIDGATSRRDELQSRRTWRYGARYARAVQLPPPEAQS